MSILALCSVLETEALYAMWGHRKRYQGGHEAKAAGMKGEFMPPLLEFQGKGKAW